MRDGREVLERSLLTETRQARPKQPVSIEMTRMSLHAMQSQS